MKFNITLAHFVQYNSPRSGSEWFPDPIPGTIVRPAVWDSNEPAGRLVWSGYCQMEAKAKRPMPELSADSFRDALNKFLYFLQGSGRDNYQRVYRITQEADTLPSAP